MPEELVQYVDFVEKQTGVQVSMVSIGPDRSETILKEGAL